MNIKLMKALEISSPPTEKIVTEVNYAETIFNNDFTENCFRADSKRNCTQKDIYWILKIFAKVHSESFLEVVLRRFDYYLCVESPYLLLYVDFLMEN